MNNLIQISDCHIDECEHSMGVNTHQNLIAIIQKITTMDIDALLISGDLSHYGSLKSYQILKKILNPVKNKLFVLAGNHDNKTNLKQVFATHLFKRFSLGKWEIINIDSVKANKTSGYLTKNTLNELECLLLQSTAQYIFLVLHHPIVPMNSTWDDALSLENPEELFDVLGKYPKIQAVMFGHAHEAGEFKRFNLKIIACPSTAKQFNSESRIGFNHYKLFDNGKMDIQTQWI